MFTLAMAGAALLAFAALWWLHRQRRAVARSLFVQELAVTVDGRFVPDLVSVVRGWPVRLNFYREEASPAHDRICFHAFGIERALPPFTVVSVDFLPTRAGEFLFVSATRPIAGMLIVK